MKFLLLHQFYLKNFIILYDISIILSFILLQQINYIKKISYWNLSKTDEQFSYIEQIYSDICFSILILNNKQTQQEKKIDYMSMVHLIAHLE